MLRIIVSRGSVGGSWLHPCSNGEFRGQLPLKNCKFEFKKPPVYEGLISLSINKQCVYFFLIARMLKYINRTFMTWEARKNHFTFLNISNYGNCQPLRKYVTALRIFAENMQQVSMLRNCSGSKYEFFGYVFSRFDTNFRSLNNLFRSLNGRF